MRMVMKFVKANPLEAAALAFQAVLAAAGAIFLIMGIHQGFNK